MRAGWGLILSLIRFSASNGLTTREGDFMWSYEANGIWQTVVIRKNSTLEQSFRAKLYDKDTKKWTLSNNKTVSEKFYDRVNISEDGKLILRNSTLNDSGNYKCSFKGLIDRGLPRESVVNLSVKPFQGKLSLSFLTYSANLVGEGLESSTFNHSTNQSINHSITPH